MQQVFYNSTRGMEEKVTASYAITQGLAKDGGLFVPDHIPALEQSMEALGDMTYQEVAYEVLKRFFTDFTEEELKRCIQGAYDGKFDHKEIAPLVKVGDLHYLELFHGATIAFKDMALSILPYLMMTAAKKQAIEDEIVILAATSGDTGKAALAGFADVEGTRIVVFYPKDGVSPIQKQQMVTQQGENTYVVGIEGNFDDAQNGVKRIFADEAFAARMKANHKQFSSANSINIGRLVPQVAYYVYAYSRLVKAGEVRSGEAVNFAVPTGNFGNILAAYYAKQMGVPVGKLVCASNDNKVLYDFLRTGVYDRRREFMLTISPSMDILISSNLERLLYEIAGQDPGETKRLMEDLQSQGYYEITPAMKGKLQDFFGAFADEAQTKAAIAQVFEGEGYLLDPHTAVAYHACRRYQEETGDRRTMVVVSTASPYKFTASTMEAIGQEYAGQDDFELVECMNERSGVPVPKAVTEVLESPVRHKDTCKKEEMPQVVAAFLGLGEVQ
ncbi:threonine synthase [Anaerotalea alkaliphila]|uniref:Threonine synthase n=1 Tax=Anaerotalea alkaliphila TaxID=2662126 RepID=A0A7X5HUV9_9FIRM|nr:threonine synthase [Anaerotalea alkaliphila]NDL67103.1 threonine synthase [Anaerotalea alkaliphila]